MFTYDTYTTLIVSVKLPNIPGCSPEDAETNAREKYSQLSERLTNLSSEQFPHMRIAVDHIDEIEILQNPQPASISSPSSYTSMASLLSAPTDRRDTPGYTRLRN